MSLEHFWGKTSDKMAAKSTKKLQDKKNTLASSASKTQDGDTETTETVLNPAMSKAMAAITSNISEMMEAKSDSFLHKIGDIAKELQDTTKRVDEAEQRISPVEDTNVETEQRVSYLEKAVGLLQERLDDQEDRGRRKNIRIIGLPESSEGTSAIHFMESWIPQVLGLTTKAGKIKLETAHRVSGFLRRGAKPRKPYPRVMIVRFHHYGDRARVLEAARWVKTVHFEGNRIFFFQDFSSGTQRKRRAFDEARKKLQSIGIRTYGLNYPATLRITVNNTTKSFDNPEEAMTFINTLRREDSAPDG